ncbi:MAG TPA: hypothetical protein VHY19_13155 [Steroidobacteraceae bacterium]|jgi:hypothetical protein|nr:hypothetical protein [Steroidobacteraceae bacterium]
MRARAPTRPAALLTALLLTLAPACAAAALRVVVIEGLGGEADYTVQFDTEARALAAAAARITSGDDVRLLVGPDATRGAVLSYFRRLAATMSRDDRLILYLIGHGSYDGRQYKFNIPGPDLTDYDLAMMLDALPARRQLIVATGSASGALLSPLRKPGRILITGTRNGAERNVTHFGAAFVAALTAASADLDKNGTISAQEAYDYANRRVQDYFKHQALLASEHAVLQGDGGELFTVADLAPAPGSAPAAAGGSVTGARAAGAPATALTRRRDQLNARIRALEQRKATLPPAQYASQLDPLLLELAEVQERIDQTDGSDAH